MQDLLLFIDNKEKILTFLWWIPIYVYFVIFLVIIFFIYLFLRSQSKSKIISWWSINIEWNWNNVIK